MGRVQRVPLITGRCKAYRLCAPPADARQQAYSTPLWCLLVFLSLPSLPPCRNEVLAPSTACTLLQQALQFLMHDYSDQCLAMIRNK